MKKLQRISVLLICLITLALPVCVQAFGFFHDPAATVAVLHASGDVEVNVTMISHSDGRSLHPKLRKDRRVWETLFRLYREDDYYMDGKIYWFGNSYDFENATLTARDGDREFTVPIPYSELKKDDYDDYLILDMKAGTLSAGVPWTRSAAIMLLHLAIYLAIEAVILRLVGIRSRRSWIVFLLYTIPTKAIICFISRTWVNCDPRAYIVFAVASIFYLMFDLAFLTLLMDSTKDKVGKFAASANVAAALIIFWSFKNLPM